jgi:hypothetical protein
MFATVMLILHFPHTHPLHQWDNLLRRDLPLFILGMCVKDLQLVFLEHPKARVPGYVCEEGEGSVACQCGAGEGERLAGGWGRDGGSRGGRGGTSRRRRRKGLVLLLLLRLVVVVLGDGAEHG